MEIITIEDRLAIIEKNQKTILKKLDALSKQCTPPIDFTRYPWVGISLPSFKRYNTSYKPIDLL